MWLQMALFHSVLSLSHIPLRMYHIFFIHSSVDGHLGCFHVLATVNHAVMITGVHVSFWIRVLSRYMSKGVIAGSFVHAKPLQSCPTLWDPTDCILPGSSVHGILQAKILEWVAVSSPRGSFQPRGWTSVSYTSCISRQVFTTRATWEARWIIW